MPGAVNQTLLNELSSAYIYFKEKENIYSSLEVYQSQIQSTIDKCNKTLLKNKWITIIAFFSFSWLLFKPYDMLLTQFAQNISFEKLGQLVGEAKSISASIGGLLLGFLFLIMPIGVFVILFVILRHALIKLILFLKKKI